MSWIIPCNLIKLYLHHHILIYIICIFPVRFFYTIITTYILIITWTPIRHMYFIHHLHPLYQLYKHQHLFPLLNYPTTHHICSIFLQFKMSYIPIIYLLMYHHGKIPPHSIRLVLMEVSHTWWNIIPHTWPTQKLKPNNLCPKFRLYIFHPCHLSKSSILDGFLISHQLQNHPFSILKLSSLHLQPHLKP